MIDDLAVLQTVRLKGRVAPADLGVVLGADCVAVVERLVVDGVLAGGPAVRLAPEGRTRLTELLAAERAAVDADAAADVYADFVPINADFKAALSTWQLVREEGTPAAAAEVLARVEDVHARVVPVIAAAAGLVGRLARYADRLATALRLAREGDLTWLSRPLVDSYHTVWFELHEELIGLAGRTRDAD